MKRIILRAGRDKPVLHHHPWVFSGAIARVEGSPNDGDIVVVADQAGNFLAQGYYNARSQITVRLLSWDEGEVIDRAFFQRRLERAIAVRQDLATDESTTAYRLVFAESDGLPGLIVDRYNDHLVVQFLTLGIECQKALITGLLAEMLSPTGIYERSDVDVRQYEGLEPSTGLLWGEMPPDLMEIRENGYRFLVDVKAGQKTGFYLDQRENRARVRDFSTGREVLNCFSYTGGFAVYAAAAGAGPIINVESSAEALDLAQRNMALNGLGFGRHDVYEEGDVFTILRLFRDQGRSFDLAILDPPKFAHTQAQIASAARGYKDINLLALQLLRPGGILFTMSCSGLVSADLFQKIVFGAAVDARRDVQIIGRLTQGVDHPILLSFPEGEYLKGLVCRVL